MSHFLHFIGRWLIIPSALVAGLELSPAAAQGVLTVAMTAGDLPVTTGNPDQGFDGLHEYEPEQALMIFVVHDLNPRALSPKVHGFVLAQNW